MTKTEKEVAECRKLSGRKPEETKVSDVNVKIHCEKPTRTELIERDLRYILFAIEKNKRTKGESDFYLKQFKEQSFLRLYGTGSTFNENEEINNLKNQRNGKSVMLR